MEASSERKSPCHIGVAQPVWSLAIGADGSSRGGVAIWGRNECPLFGLVIALSMQGAASEIDPELVPSAC